MTLPVSVFLNCIFDSSLDVNCLYIYVYDSVYILILYVLSKTVSVKCHNKSFMISVNEFIFFSKKVK